MLASDFLLLFACLARADRYSEVGLQPGRAKQDYDSVEEVRGHENETETEKPEQQAEQHLTREAILDVAYYLRRFKFSGHDPRYLAKGEIPQQNLFVGFPSPPLRNIHWEVKKNCEPSFLECVKYLQEQVSQTVLPRHLDSLTITKQNGWSFITDKDLIKPANDECLKLLLADEQTFNVFSGPLQKFQWLTSASYYMCLYTMKETSYLRNFTEDCDNFAACIQWEFGLNNRDVRGDNSQPFACAFYSFCPDPCCPLKYLPDWSACAQSSPCLGEYSTDPTCTLSRKENSHFESLVMNQWNITCSCDLSGMRWESKSGMCVDIDECIEEKTVCDRPAESCRNLPGSYKCACSPLGYRRDAETERCERDPFLDHLFNPQVLPTRNQTNAFSFEYFAKMKKLILKIKVFLLAVLTGNEKEPNESEFF